MNWKKWFAQCDVKLNIFTWFQSPMINNGCILLKNSYIYSDKKLVTVSNISDFNVVATEDAILITKKSKTYEIISLLKILEKKKRNELIEHFITTRPWGSFENIISNKAIRRKWLWGFSYMHCKNSI